MTPVSQFENTMQTNHRILTADVIKGAGIVLVVLGHAIQSNLDSFDQNIFFRIIYSFHMPLFMVVSGWFAKPGEPTRIRKDAIRLLVPVLSWYVIQWFVTGEAAKVSLAQYFFEFLKAPDLGLWFLWILFLCHAVIFGCRHLERLTGIAAYFIGAVALWLIPLHSFGIPMLRFNFLFFLGGYAVARNWSAIAPYRTWVVSLSAVTWPIAFHFWQRVAPAPSGVLLVFHAHTLSTGIVEFSISRFLSPVLGIILFSWMCSLTPQGRIVVAAAWLGRRTLEIYASHQLFLKILPVRGPAAVLPAFLAALALSLAITEIFRRNWFTNLILFGVVAPSARKSDTRHAGGTLKRAQTE